MLNYSSATMNDSSSGSNESTLRLNVSGSAYTSSGYDRKKVSSLFLLSCIAMLGLMIALLNGLVIVCGLVYRRRLLRTHAAVAQILSLSLGDFIVGTTTVIVALNLPFFETGVADTELCVVWLGAWLIPMTGTVYHILSLCILRFAIAMKHTVTYKHTVLSVACVWIVTPVLGSIPFLLWRRRGPVSACTWEAVFEQHNDSATIFLASMGLVPLLLTDTLYFLLAWFLRPGSKKAGPPHVTRMNSPRVVGGETSGSICAVTYDPTSGRTASATRRVSGSFGHSLSGTNDITSQRIRHSRRNRLKAIKTISLIVLIFNISRLPLILALLAEGMFSCIHLSRSVRLVLFSLSLVNSITNPLVYAVWMKTFRLFLIEMMSSFIHRLLCFSQQR